MTLALDSNATPESFGVTTGLAVPTAGPTAPDSMGDPLALPGLAGAIAVLGAVGS